MSSVVYLISYFAAGDSLRSDTPRCQAGHRQSAPVASFAEPTARASCAQYQTPPQRWFEWRRPTPVTRPANCGETGRAASHQAWTHQTLGLEAAFSRAVRWQGTRLLVQARAYLEADQGPEGVLPAGAGQGGVSGLVYAAPDRRFDQIGRPLSGETALDLFDTGNVSNGPDLLQSAGNIGKGRKALASGMQVDQIVVALFGQGPLVG